jgi:hypothetical protein
LHDESDSPPEPEAAPWTTIQRRRTRSLGSLDRVRNHSGNNRTRGLTLEQIQVVNTAADALTDSQRRTLNERKKKTAHRRGNSSSSREEGTSKRKGKIIDPREWGNVNISESVDVEAQAAAFRSLAKRRADGPTEKKTDKSTTRARRTKNRGDSPQGTRLPHESRPVAQLAKGSYIGMALRDVGRSTNNKRPRRSGDNSPPSSEPGSTDSGSSGSEKDDSYSERPRRRRDNRHGRNRRRRSSSSSSGNSKIRIKPIAPKEYNGGADARAYHHFVRESEAYLRDGKVKGRRRIFLLSYYLTDKAYDFYTQKVANNEPDWTLSAFYDELFNYCFPVDYRMQLRKTLARCHQNDKSVAEYTHELNELFNMIGDIPERDQVLKFWNGVQPVIQKGLWRDIRVLAHFGSGIIKH